MNENVKMSMLFVLVLCIGLFEGYYLHESINHYNTVQEAKKMLDERNNYSEKLTNLSVIQLDCKGDFDGRK